MRDRNKQIYGASGGSPTAGSGRRLPATFHVIELAAVKTQDVEVAVFDIGWRSQAKHHCCNFIIAPFNLVIMHGADPYSHGRLNS